MRLTHVSLPPVGIMPKYIVWEKRLDEIDSAIDRYISNYREIPEEWITERNEIIGYLNKRER
ncbi:hypothetical protein NL868_001299 [Shigella flexneri]|nr:hypothetical protein [Shigella flexneri]